MTRTARSTYPRAVLKDRSQSRSGMDKSLKKDGAGKGNWGKLGDVEYGEVEYDEESDVRNVENTSSSETGSEASSPPSDLKTTYSSDEKEIEAAKAFRKRALSGTVDLSSIARTSVAVSSSPPKV
ncbi:hypothetical protein D9757_001353 [Collybiopsis confluens]|uniref:Hyaluronan/mRNA-binding protein domain-containing protein n=1 Tax=Collybiopsis confluens TaxID=2823264 RepID=A0A8H5MGK4_9AGAR|nr:hypothetical protein D9757_001353 [Collybiopsis confluens]